MPNTNTHLNLPHLKKGLVRETLLRESIHNRRREDPAVSHSRPKLWLAALLIIAMPGYALFEDEVISELISNSDAGLVNGKSVKKIPVNSGVEDWQAVDPRHVILTLGKSDEYMLTLGRDCHGLAFADNLGVSTSNNAIYAGFDYVTADNRKCAISAINKLDRTN